ncbi:MAG: tetrathionate reductase family octaheme c-type cytochrome [Magnetococcales bacterium]|nr:tetrathionate reductase family octaheme c-type cytochrome [Magnetococcales bacterium]
MIQSSIRPASPVSCLWGLLLSLFMAQLVIIGHVGEAWGENRIALPLSTTRHDLLPSLAGPFSSGREVTRACLGCHTEAAAMVRRNIHWTWEFSDASTGRTYGKNHVLNTFCGSVASNMRECTTCHVGYGWKDPETNQVADDQVDCLVCHEQTGTYKKYNYGWSELRFKDKIIRKPDYVALARSVGRPSRSNCGSCHFRGGSGDGAKHGDLDSSLVWPDRSLDVHMNADGLNFACITCHNADGHRITGSRYVVKAQDSLGIDRPGRSDDTHTSCASCHGNAPHPGQFKLDDHVDRVACQTCHIPAMARGGVKTMVHWDWRTAGHEIGGSDIPEVLRTHGHSSQEVDVRHTPNHGTTLWAENLTPRYAWFNGKVEYMGLKEKLKTADLAQVNRIFGSARDPDARIWPFKRMFAMTPFDPINRTLVVNHLIKSDADDREAFEVSYDWRMSVAAGMKEADAPFSGQVGFIRAVMHFPLTHMIAPKEEALKCRECHRDGGRMDGIEGIYMPGRRNNPLLHQIGKIFVILTLTGVGVHSSMRLLIHLGRRK